MNIFIKIILIISLSVSIVLVYKNTDEKMQGSILMIEKLHQQFQISREENLKKEISRLQSKVGGTVIFPSIFISFMAISVVALVISLTPKPR